MTIAFLVTDSSYAYTTNFNKPSANYYLVCPYCTTKTNAESDSGVKKQCSNEKCKADLSSQPVVPAGKEAFKLVSQIKEERIRKASSLNIKSSNGIKCPYCLHNSELDRYELLAIVEGRKSRTIICDGKNCGRTYDLIDGLNFYEIQRQKEVRAIMAGVAIVGCAVAVAAIAANSRRGGYAPTYIAPRIPTYANATNTVTTFTPVIASSGSQTYLGRLSANKYDYDSTSNPYGPYGSPYSSTSINNPYGQYGSPYSSTSANNSYSFNAPKIYGADGAYLGKLSGNKYDPESVSNPYGIYGSRYSATSVNNPYSQYGSPYSSESANNPYASASNAPVIIGDSN